MKPEKKFNLNDAITSGPVLDRRHFLIGSGLVVAMAPVTFPGTENVTDLTTWNTPQAAVFHQMPYFSFDGTGEQYLAPKQSGASKSTRHYVDSISHEEYLRRHWFI